MIVCVPLTAKPPGYKHVTEKLKDLWKEKYPFDADFLPDPEKHGAISAIAGGRVVFYYHYRVTLPLLSRDGVTGKRNSELWVRYRPEESKPYDLTFARRDMLPGTSKAWFKP
jgi:hypothetical protein